MVRGLRLARVRRRLEVLIGRRWRWLRPAPPRPGRNAPPRRGEWPLPGGMLKAEARGASPLRFPARALASGLLPRPHLRKRLCMAHPAGVRPMDSRWLGRWCLLPQTLPLPMPRGDGRAPPESRCIAQPVRSIVPAVPPRHPPTPWCSITSRPFSPSRKKLTPWAEGSPLGWSATSAATRGAASRPTASRGCDAGRWAARTGGTTGSWLSTARVEEPSPSHSLSRALARRRH